MTKAAQTKASPVVASFEFDCKAYVAHAGTADSAIAAQVRMIHSAIKPGVTHAAIAARIEEFDTKGVLGPNVKMDVSHYAQTAALAIADSTTLQSKAYASDAMLAQLYKLRTTGTVDDRRAMLAAFTGSEEEFGTYAKAWAKKAREAAQAARDAKRTAPPAKGAKAPEEPKGLAAPVADRELSFAEVLAQLDRIIRETTDDKKRDEYRKAVQVRLVRLTKATPATVAAA